MKAPVFEHEGRVFRTKTELLQAIREVLHAPPYKLSVASRLSLDHARFIYALLLAKHPCVEAVVGPGCAELWVRNDNKGDTSGFHVLRVDGTWKAFSIQHFTKDDHRSPENDARRAFRDETRIQLNELKDAWFSASSRVALDPFSAWSVVTFGVRVSRESCEVDHFQPTFAELLKTFLNGRPLEQIAVRRDGREGNRDFFLADQRVAWSWHEYHRFYCLDPALAWIYGRIESLSGLRIVSVEEHRQITSQQQRGRKR